MHRLCTMVFLFAGTLLTALAGCNSRTKDSGGGNEALPVPVAQPVSRKVADFVDYTGRTNAKVQVVVQARVTGELKETPFKEGAYVKAGDILFKIDDRPYKGQLQAAEAQFKAAQSQIKSAESQVKAAESQLDAAKKQLEANEAKQKYDIATNERFKELAKKQPGAVSARELDQYQANEDLSKANVSLGGANIVTAEANIVTAKANVALAEANLAYAAANLEQPKLNVDWTNVKAPIDGHISRYYIQLGNLVNQDSTQLTTIMSVDPMYVYFDMDEPNFIRIKQAMDLGKIKSHKQESLPPFVKYASQTGLLSWLQLLGPLPAAVALHPEMEEGAPVFIGLQGEEGFDDEFGKPRHAGFINFVDNQVNAGTDSIQVRGSFVNPKLKDGSRLLVPGQFVRVRFPIGQEEERLLIIDRAVISEQGQKKVFVINTETNKVEERIVVLGPLLDNGLRVVSGKNFTEKDWVMFSSLQLVRPGIEVQPEWRTMPELGKPSVLIDKGKKAKS